VECHRRKGYPGLWAEQRKIASIGVQLKRWVSMHGMAINVSNDLGIFGNIVPCGLEDVEITSVSRETGTDVSVDEVKDVLGRLCMDHWSSEEDGEEEGGCDG
jgi:lipoyl(octanoyl) transferase